VEEHFTISPKKKSLELTGPIILKDAVISINDEHKKKIAIQVATGGDTFLFAFEDEDKRKDWLVALEEHKTKEVSSPANSVGSTPGKKKQSTSMRIKKNVGGSVATSGAGKGLIKEFLGKDGVKLLDIIKKVITIHDGKKKAEEVENTIIRISVKVILLWKNKDLTIKDISGTIPGVKSVWSDIIDFCEMSFAYDPVKIKSHGEGLQLAFSNLLADFMTEKNLENMREVLTYLVTKELLDRLFADNSQEELKKELNRILRGGWIAVFKNDKQ